MLAREARIIDLDHIGMTNLSRMLQEHEQAERKRTLFILHRDGEVLAAVDSESGARPSPLERIDDPQSNALEILAYNSDLQRVVLLERDALLAFARKINNPAAGTGLVEYLIERFRLFHYGMGRGIVVHPLPDGQWNHFDYEFVKDLVRSFPERCCAVIGLFKGQSYFASLIVGIEEQRINLITTFEHLVSAGLAWPPLPVDMEQIIALIERHVAPIALGIATEPAVFRRLLFERLKRPVLQSTRRSGRILWEKDIERILEY